MSVYKRKGAKTYQYDFWVRGNRFLGDTGCEEKRQAVRELERIRRDAEAKVAQAVQLGSPRTWQHAASRYYEEVGKHHKALDMTLASLDWLTREIGANTLLTAINDNVVAQLVAKRRAEMRLVGNAETVKRTVSPATVNRTMTEPLRKVMSRAAKIWKVPVGDVRWTQHMLDEPQERIREASKSEEARIMGKLDRGYEEAVKFAFANGCRRMEIVGFRKTQIDFFTRQFSVLGKGGKTRSIPMSDETYAQLWRLKDDPTEFVFTYVAKRTDKRKGIVRGVRYPITDAGLRTAMRRAVKAAGVPDFRFHDTRHTAATRVLRKSNLRVVQNLLGHADVTTTTKYAHALAEDVRAALNAASPVKSPVTGSDDGAKVLKDNGNSG